MAPEVEQQGGAVARERLYQLAAELAPSCPQPHGQLAQLYDENGAYTAAVEQYRLAAELAGETSLAGYYYFNEGSLHIRHTGNFEQAIFTFEQAEVLAAWVTGEVFQGAPAYNLGLVYKNAGMYEEAVASFERVMACGGCSFLQRSAAAELATLEGE
jgi:tetratricopeptide (TPR) repeat protein